MASHTVSATPKCFSMSLLSDLTLGEIQLMIKKSAALMMPLLALVVFAYATPVTAQVTASSCSYSDVQSAVVSVARGGTVTVPSGNCSWGSTLTLTAGITLQGAGVGNTVITSTGTMISVEPDSTAIANSENIKITGFTFDGNNAAGIFIGIEGASGINGTKPYRYLLIGDNKFQNASTSLSAGVIEAGANNDGEISGVIYHNTFDRCNIILRIFSNNDTREWANTAFNQFTYGSPDNLYFEDNTIQYSSSSSANNPGWIEVGQGGRLVGRFNTWNLANATTPQEIWDIHGFQNWNGQVDSGQTSTMLVEYYDNTLSNMGTYRWIDHRGSWGMFFDNVLTGSGGNSIDLYGMSTPGSCPSDINPTPSNYNPVINNTYFFNNTKNGTNVTASVVSTGSPTHCSVAENANWWNQQTAFNGTAGVGRGLLSARPATCKTGVGYWATDQGEWNSLHAGADGQFYKCTATNTWTQYYQPYTYPHPLRAGSQQTVSPPAPPTNLRGVVQ